MTLRHIDTRLAARLLTYSSRSALGHQLSSTLKTRPAAVLGWVGVCLRVCACVCVGGCVCVWVGMGARACVRAHACG